MNDQNSRGLADVDINPSVYTDASRARLAMAHEARELADLAREAVPIDAHEPHADSTDSTGRTGRSPGSLLADAAHVLKAAHRFFEAAAVCERLGGASWQVLGDALGVDAATARTRFAAAESCFREELRSPEVPVTASGASDGAGWWRAYTAGNPLEAARDLDDWVLRHADGDGDHHHGAHRPDNHHSHHLGATPVSGGLTRIDSHLK
ncbi:hypothetical protein [Streptomyces sp. SYP-A7185]|uniref:hypothetical protein n=1 Tax=Streptomyces sp. SYP-A7185 TaxID=3040076 RepID=UPI0038F6BB57